MRFNPVPLMAVLLLYSYAGSAQVVPTQREDESRYSLALKSGSFIPSKNISDTSIQAFNTTAMRPGGKTFLVIQF